MSRFAGRAGERIAELADLSAEAGRLSRGRTLFRKGAVTDLAVLEGSILAAVRGSEGDEYETSIGTVLAPPGVIRQIAEVYDRVNPQSIDELIDDGLDVCPREIDLAFACGCADWDEPCKHVVAVLLAFADRVDLDEAELLRWRGIDLAALGDTERTTPTRSLRQSRPTTAPKSQPRSQSGVKSEPRFGDQPEERPRSEESIDRAAKLAELEALLGDTVMRVPAAKESEPEGSATTIEPALAEFLGVGTVLEPPEVNGIRPPGPLFADMQLGPLAELGPELAKATLTIIARLDDVSPGDS